VTWSASFAFRAASTCLGDHADAGGQRHDLHDTLDGPSGAVVDLLRLLVLHGRIEDRRVQHVGNLRIDAEFCRAVNLGWHVEARHVFADQAELRGRLQIGHGQLRQWIGHLRSLDQITIADCAARFGVYDDAGLGGELRYRHSPCLRCISEQHRAGLCASETQLLVIAGNRKTADGSELVAEGGIAVDFVVVGGCSKAHLAPIGVEILGQDQG
jgi:hypothetical protein